MRAVLYNNKSLSRSSALAGDTGREGAVRNLHGRGHPARNRCVESADLGRDRGVHRKTCCLGTSSQRKDRYALALPYLTTHNAGAREDFFTRCVQPLRLTPLRSICDSSRKYYDSVLSGRPVADSV